MLRELKIWWIKWIDAVWLKPEEKEKLIAKYNFHELDIEACMEWNQRARIDNYETYSFLILHFPKYIELKKLYELNEFSIFLWKDYLITFRKEPWNHINAIFNYYSNLKVNTRKKDIKVSTWYILYEITLAMLEKMFKVINNITNDLRNLEDEIFERDNKSFLVKEILIKKRNIIVLKHMFKPQIAVIKQLELTVNKLYAGEIEVYFEDLEDKLEQIINEISIIHERIESIEDAFKSMVDVKTNFVIKVLTVFSAFMLPLTLITSFYWMNIDLPFSENIKFVFFLIFLSLFLMVLTYLYLRKNWKF